MGSTPFKKVQSSNRKVQIAAAGKGLPDHAEGVELLAAVLGEAAGFAEVALAGDPAAEVHAGRGTVFDRDLEVAVGTAVTPGLFKGEGPVVLILPAPEHAQLVQTADLVGGQGQLLLAVMGTEIRNPDPQAKAVGTDIVRRDIQITVPAMVLGGRGIIALEKIVRHIPAHTDAVQGTDAIIGEVGGLDAAFAVKTQVGQPTAQFQTIGGDIAGGNVKIPILAIIGLGRLEEAVKAPVAGALPTHAEGIQKPDLVIGQGSAGLAGADLALGIQPAAEGIAVRGDIALRHIQIAVFAAVLLRLAVHEVPGGGEGIVEAVEELETVAHLVIYAEVFVDDLVLEVERTIPGGSKTHLVLNGVDAGEVFDVEDDVENNRRGRRSSAGAESAADLLLIDNRRDGRTEENDAADIRNVDAFVEHVDAEEQLEMGAVIGLEGCERTVGFRILGIGRIDMGVRVDEAEPFGHFG